MAIAIAHSSSQYWVSARDIYDLSNCKNRLLEATVCCRFYCWS